MFRRMVLFVALLLGCAASAPGIGAERQRSADDVRSGILKWITSAVAYESSSRVSTADILGHDNDNRLVAAEKKLDDGIGSIGAAQVDAATYESDAADVPANERPAGAISGVHEVQELLAKAAKYDEAAKKLEGRRDESYLSWDKTGSAAGKKEALRLNDQVFDDITQANSLKFDARDAAEKLPALPKPRAIPSRSCGREKPVSQPFIVRAVGGGIQMTTNCNFVSSRVNIKVPGHEIGSVFDGTPGESCSASGPNISCTLKTGYEKSGIASEGTYQDTINWQFAESDPGYKNSCGIEVDLTFTIVGGGSFALSGMSTAGSTVCP